MKAFITHILPIPRAAPLNDRVQLQWDLEEVDESGSFGFLIQRSGAPNGPWTDLVGGPDQDSRHDDQFAHVALST